VIGDERFELRDELGVSGEREVGLHALFQRGEAQLLEPGDVALGERFVRDVGERRPSPEGEGLAKDCGRMIGVACCQLAAPLGDEPLEALEVELVRPDVEPVPGSLRRDSLLPEPLAQRMHLHLERVSRRLLRLLAPEGVDQVVAGDDLVRAQEQAREQERLPSRAERDV